MKAIGRSDLTIAPGETQQLKFSVSSSKYSGKFTKKISVRTNDADNISTVLTCVGTVKVPFNVNPKMVSFGRIARDSESVTRTVTITQGDGGPLSLEVLPLSEREKNITTKLTEVEAGKQYELEVTAKPPWPNTSLTANIRVKTGVPESPTENIRVYGMVTPRLAAVPNRFQIPPGNSDAMDVKARLVWSGGAPGHVTEAVTTDSETSVRVEEENGQQFVVMHVPAKYAPARGRAYVTLKTDDPAAPMLRIPVYTQVLGSAAHPPSTAIRPPAAPSNAGPHSAAPPPATAGPPPPPNKRKPD